MANKMIKCKTCGADIAASAKVCPSCGAKNKKPIYKKWWFYALILIIIVAVVSSTSGGSEKKDEGPVSYTHYDVTQLFDELKGNALKAKDTYKNQYVELEGYLSVIDSDGKYISLGADPKNYDYMLDGVHCTIKTDEQRKQIMELNKGDKLVIRGKITDVGEVLGYRLDIDSVG